MNKKYLLLSLFCVDVCFAGSYPSNLANYVVSSDPKRYVQDVKYISIVASCCANISYIYNQNKNFITNNFNKYQKSVFEIIPQAIAKCMLKIDEFADVKNDIIEFKGVNTERLTQAEVNAVVLYNWIYKMTKNQNKVTIDNLAKHIETKAKFDHAKLQKAICDIKEYDKVLKLQYYVKSFKHNDALNWYAPSIKIARKDNKAKIMIQNMDGTVIYAKQIRSHILLNTC